MAKLLWEECDNPLEQEVTHILVISGVVFQNQIFAEGRVARRFVLVSITTHLTVRQIATQLALFLWNYTYF